MIGISVLLTLIAVVAFSAEPEDTSSESQLVYNDQTFSFNSQFETLAQDENGRRYMRIFVVLLVYCFVSPYNFYWFLFSKQTHDLDHYQLVSEVFQPIT